MLNVKTEANYVDLKKMFNNALSKQEFKTQLLKENTDRSLSDILNQIQEHKYNILDQQYRLTRLLEEARKRMPEPFSQEQSRGPGPDRLDRDSTPSAAGNTKDPLWVPCL